MTVNDGKGLFDNLGLIDTLIVDCNKLPQLLFNGQNVAFCAKITEMVQKLSNLKEGVKNDTESLQMQLEDKLRDIERLAGYAEKGE